MKKSMRICTNGWESILLKLCSFLLFLSSCTFIQKSFLENDEFLENYNQEMLKYSSKDQKYAGFDTIYHVRATLLNSKLRKLQMEKAKKELQYDDREVKEEERNLLQDLSNRTKIFVSFYTPNTKTKQLTKKESLWRIFLDVDGKRYVGRVRKIKGPSAQIRSEYPVHNIWSNPYEISFDVSTFEVDKKKASLVITGKLGTSKIEFPALKASI